MRSVLLLVICLCGMLSACGVRQESDVQQTCPAQTDITVPGEWDQAATVIPTWDEKVDSPEEMPSPPEADAEIPPQPQPTVISQ